MIEKDPASSKAKPRKHLATVHYSDGEHRTLSVGRGQTILEAADIQGIPIVSSCESGICGTCVGRCVSGRLSFASSIGLSEGEKDEGRFLSCQSELESDCEITFDYPLGDNAASIMSGPCQILNIEQLSAGAALLELDSSQLPPDFKYRPGQFMQLQIPRTNEWRSYSCLNGAPRAGRLEFLVRLLEQGAMSDYLRDSAQPGDVIQIRGPKGSLCLRETDTPVILIAGGTGLSATLAIAEQLCASNHPAPMLLCYGAGSAAELVLVSRLAALAKANPRFTYRTIVAVDGSDWNGPVGLVTDLLSPQDFHDGAADIYLCGPPNMVDATKTWVDTQGLEAVNLYAEQFSPSGASSRKRDPGINQKAHNVDELFQNGAGTAIVVGGSIAGISAAKMLTAHFERVIVLEKDVAHRKREGRPGAAQGWHLHHLLIAGQKMIETIFPGVINEMVSAGAFKVDMGEQYRIFLAGAWKKRIRSGIDIVCAARPLIEWCLRRRLDDDPKIDFRYESEMVDIIVHPTRKTMVGIVTSHDSASTVLAAELVVDASGKNSRLPDLLSQHGFSKPELDADEINCFYSTMYHRVPKERVWDDKVMVINYPYRPNEEHYAAQYYLDRSRTVLSTSLIGYNCYNPPRNAEEFREFARLMPDPSIGEELDGLEPISIVHNFRYPAMQRYHYHKLRNLPGGIVAVGDALSSADPVSGAGMSKAIMEIDILRTLLGHRGHTRNARFPKAFYRKARGLSDMIWDVIREQNLRFTWIRGGASKRARFSRVRNWYVDRFMEAMHESPDLYRRFLAVTHFVEPPTALMRPGVIVEVVGRWAKTKMQQQKTPIEAKYGSKPQTD